MELNKIIQGDCIEVLKTIPDESMDMTFADPPFNLNKKYNQYKDTQTESQYINWCNEWITHMVRITKPTGAIFIHNIPKWLTHYAGKLNTIAHFKHWIVWDAPSAPMGKTLMPNHYGILYYTKQKSYKDFKYNRIRYRHASCSNCKEYIKDYGGKKKLAHPYGPLLSDVWTDIHRIRHNKNRDEHPCQLPIPLLERLILMTTEENDIVFDPFMGTGTTAVAAKQMGRNYVGIELDQEYIDIANNNIDKAKPTNPHGHFISYHQGSPKTIRDKDYEEFFAKNRAKAKNGSK